MTETPPERPETPPVGPLALEAALLLDVVADRLVSMKAATPPGADGASDDDAGSQGPSEKSVPAAGRCPECGSLPGASCTACPLCRFLALLRGERPEATAKLVDGALMIIRTLRSLIPDAADPAGPPTGSRSDPSQSQHPSQSHPSPPARRGGLEHIDIL